MTKHGKAGKTKAKSSAKAKPKVKVKARTKAKAPLDAKIIDHDEIRNSYIAEMRAITPAIRAWWNERCPYPWTKEVPPEEMTDFHRRWIVGPAGHPRIVDVFRKYFFAILELNDTGVGFRRPIDLLVNDLEKRAPDLFEIMQGFLFIPIGMTPDGEDD